MSKRNLFVSFAESDGGHSYLAARAMLDPGSIAHLIFRNTVAESLEAVAAGQANYAIVPSYNSITQWDGATMKALSTGQFEICAQVCMPTSYVLVAHKDYMTDFVNAYRTVKGKDLPEGPLTQEEEAKIYTRFLSRIFVSPQAEEQYRGRLLRPDMTNATIDLSRNPLRVLEQLSRSDLLKLITSARPGGGYQQPQQPSIGVGSSPFLQPITTQVMQGPAVTELMQAPAALVASGLLDAPGDPEGWDQPGSLGEIVALLRKLLVLLNVYSFGSPDLPENKTQYLMLGRRGAGAPPADAIRSPAAAPKRIMTRVTSGLKKSSADQWLAPRRELTKRASHFGFVFDRPPVLLSPGNQRVFLFEGGHPKDGVTPISGMLDWIGDAFQPPADAKSGKPSARRGKANTLRKALEKKPAVEPKDGSRDKFDTVFLGEYPTWCHGLSDDACWCCEEAHGEQKEAAGDGAAFFTGLFALAAIVGLLLLGYFLYCTFSGSCWSSTLPTAEPFTPRVEATQPPPVAPPPPAPVQVTKVEPPKVEQTTTTYPGVSSNQTTAVKPVTRPVAPVAPPAPRYEAPKPPVFHVAFFEAKSNLQPESMSALGSAAAQAMQQNKTVMLRIVALGPRESDDELWRRRLYAVKDELVRLGVPAGRIRQEGSGPYVITIRAKQPPVSTRKGPTYDLDSIADPLSEE